MANSHHRLYVHLVYAPKYRRALIGPGLKALVEGYLIGICKKLEVQSLEIYANPDHVHQLIACKTTHTPSKIVNKLKSNSSKWIAENHMPEFAWQRGAGYFSVGHREVDGIRRYIRNQRRHHVNLSLDEEFDRLLTDHGLLEDSPPAYRLKSPTQ